MNFPELPISPEIKQPTSERVEILLGMLERTAQDIASCVRDGSSRGILWANTQAMGVIARGSTPEEQAGLHDYFSKRLSSCLGSSSTLSAFCAYRAMLSEEVPRPYSE